MRQFTTLTLVLLFAFGVCLVQGCTSRCSNCTGSGYAENGKVACGGCSAAGVVETGKVNRNPCSACSGTGKQPKRVTTDCGSCQGGSNRVFKVCTNCARSGRDPQCRVCRWESKQCTSCDGKGNKQTSSSGNCSSCGGERSSLSKEVKKCSRCNGKKYECRSCDGSGKV